MLRTLLGLVIAALVALTGLATAPSPAAAQPREHWGVGGPGAYRHHGPRFHGRHYGHAPRHFRGDRHWRAPVRPRRHHYRPYVHPSPAWLNPRPYVDLYVPSPRYVRPYHHRRTVNLSASHVRWCHNRYRSYRAWDNSFQPYNGPRRQCFSPFG